MNGWLELAMNGLIGRSSGTAGMVRIPSLTRRWQFREDDVTNRRAVLKMATVAVGGSWLGSGHAQPSLSSAYLSKIDHLVYATPDLDVGIAKLDQMLGVRATPGGQHPGRGTRNALLALGPSTYLEIIGPDPDQPKPDVPRAFGIDDLNAPRLAAWAANGTNLDRLARDAAASGIGLGAVSSGTRTRPDGLVLSWRFTDPSAVVADGIVPFFIDWGRTPHPARSAAQGLSLIELRAEHPQPQLVRMMLSELGIDLAVQRGLSPQLTATIASPRGRVELR